MKTLEFYAKISLLSQEIKDKQKELNNLEIEPEDYTEQFNELLDEAGYINVCGYDMLPSQILKECDPIAYRQELLYYVDTLDITQTQEYKDLEEKIENLENELETLREGQE